MKVIDPGTIEKYERSLQKDPNSKVFAALADALREVGKLVRAEEVARHGLKIHPEYVGGYVALGRTLFQAKRFDEAVPVLQKAVSVSPENLLAYQLLGSCFIELKNPKEALRAHKMALFLNPLSERSQQAVRKLEILSAEEYGKEIFESIHEADEESDFSFRQVSSTPTKLDSQKNTMPGDHSKMALERELSYVDALILRGEVQKAKDHLLRIKLKGQRGPEIEERLELVGSEDDPNDVHAYSSGEARKLELDQKIKVLKQVLKAIANKRTELMQPR
jgi:tetratricopeptide (TPR) repeat protein